MRKKLWRCGTQSLYFFTTLFSSIPASDTSMVTSVMPRWDVKTCWSNSVTERCPFQIISSHHWVLDVLGWFFMLFTQVYQKDFLDFNENCWLIRRILHCRPSSNGDCFRCSIRGESFGCDCNQPFRITVLCFRYRPHIYPDYCTYGNGFTFCINSRYMTSFVISKARSQMQSLNYRRLRTGTPIDHSSLPFFHTPNWN